MGVNPKRGLGGAGAGGGVFIPDGVCEANSCKTNQTSRAVVLVECERAWHGGRIAWVRTMGAGRYTGAARGAKATAHLHPCLAVTRVELSFGGARVTRMPLRQALPRVVYVELPVCRRRVEVE